MVGLEDAHLLILTLTPGAPYACLCSPHTSTVCPVQLCRSSLLLVCFPGLVFLQILCPFSLPLCTFVTASGDCPCGPWSLHTLLPASGPLPELPAGESPPSAGLVRSEPFRTP